MVIGMVAATLPGAFAQRADEEGSLRSMSAGTRYLSRYTACGTDLGNDLAALRVNRPRALGEVDQISDSGPTQFSRHSRSAVCPRGALANGVHFATLSA